MHRSRVESSSWRMAACVWDGHRVLECDPEWRTGPSLLAPRSNIWAKEVKACETTHTHLVNIAWLAEVGSSIPMIINILYHRDMVMEIHRMLKIECWVELLDPRFHSLRWLKRPGGLYTILSHSEVGSTRFYQRKEKPNTMNNPEMWKERTYLRRPILSSRSQHIHT